MIISESRLKQIIKEELEEVLSERVYNYNFTFDEDGVKFFDRQGRPGQKYFRKFSDEYDIIAGAAYRNPEKEDQLSDLIEKMRPKNPRPNPRDDFNFHNTEMIRR